MKYLFAIAIAFLSASTAFAETSEEQKLISVIIANASAKSYDVNCNGGRVTKDPLASSEATLFHGNSAMITSLVAEKMKKKNPALTDDEISNRLSYISNDISYKLGEKLKEEGCETTDAKKASSSLMLFSTTPREKLAEFIMSMSSQ